MSLIVATLLGILLVTFGLGLFVAVTLGMTAIAMGALFSDRPILDMLATIPWNAINNTTLVALPLFILMGEILLRSGVTEGMYTTLSKWLNRLPGSLLHTNIAACGVFACISGSSAATAATVGGVALPFLRSRGYSNQLSLGTLAAGGTLGILIPPSIVMIVYGVLAQESIGRLYMAGVVPGLLMMALFMVMVYGISLVRPAVAPRIEPSSWREMLVSLGRLAPIAALIALVLGTIYAGIATATEAAAFGVTGALAVAFLNGRVDRRMLRDTLLATASTTSMIMFILIGAILLQFVIAFLGVPTAMTRWVTELGLTRMEFVLLVCALYLVLGMFMESLSIVVITLPVILPLLKAFGVDLVWFGILIVILVEAALITPPVGMNLFILQGMADRVSGGTPPRPVDLYIGILPFLVAMLFTLGLLLAFPSIALWLPGQ